LLKELDGIVKSHEVVTNWLAKVEASKLWANVSCSGSERAKREHSQIERDTTREYLSRKLTKCRTTVSMQGSKFRTKFQNLALRSASCFFSGLAFYWHVNIWTHKEKPKCISSTFMNISLICDLKKTNYIVCFKTLIFSSYQQPN